MTRNRTEAGRQVANALATGKLQLQQCRDCGAVQYPPAACCRACLSDALAVNSVDATGTVVAAVAVHHSLADDFAEDGPWPVLSVKLESGPVVLAHAASTLPGGTPVRLIALTDRLGDGVLGAVIDDQQADVMRSRFGAKL